MTSAFPEEENGLMENNEQVARWRPIQESPPEILREPAPAITRHPATRATYPAAHRLPT